MKTERKEGKSDVNEEVENGGQHAFVAFEEVWVTSEKKPSDTTSMRFEL